MKGIRSYNSNFDLIPDRHKANEIAKSLLLHSSTVIALFCIWYCIGLLFYELLNGLPLSTGNWVIEKMEHVQH